MATTVRVTRLANPRKRRHVAARRVKVTRRRRPNAARAGGRHRRRKLTPKQIRFFGSARQKAALRASRKRKAARHVTAGTRKANPIRRRRRVASRRNPALVVTLGSVVNPKRRVHTMARRKRARKTNPRRRHTIARRRHNATRVVVVAPRHRRRSRRVANPIRRRRHVSYRRRHRNPAAVFGHSVLGKQGLLVVGGGLLGVAAAKFIPTLLPASITSTGGAIGRTVITGLSAWGASMVAAKIPGMGAAFADAVFFGGLMQAGSVALNSLLPGFKIGGVPVALNGMGDLVAGQFSVPQNPLRLAAPPAQARVQMNGLARAFGVAL